MISYKPLFDFLDANNISKWSLTSDVGLGRATVQKLIHNQNVQLDIIDRICTHYNLRIEQVVFINMD